MACELAGSISINIATPAFKNAKVFQTRHLRSWLLFLAIKISLYRYTTVLVTWYSLSKLFFFVNHFFL